MRQSLQSLPPAERARRYRQFAADAIRRAENALTPDLRAGYLSMAADWHALAIEVEQSAGAAHDPPQDGDGDRRERN